RAGGQQQQHRKQPAARPPARSLGCQDATALSPTPSLRNTAAPMSSSPYMHTTSGPVGRSFVYESHRPRIDASAPELHAMIVSFRLSAVNRFAITAGTTRKLKTISTPAMGTANVITTPNDR